VEQQDGTEDPEQVERQIDQGGNYKDERAA
jgi:hypothetical protein